MNPRKRSLEHPLETGIETPSRLKRKIEYLEEDCRIADRYIDDLKQDRDHLRRKNDQLYTVNEALQKKISLRDKESAEIKTNRQKDKEKIVDLESQVATLFKQIAFLQQQTLHDKNSLPVPPWNPNELLNHHNRDVIKIIAALPKPWTSNPIATLINFFRHQIHVDVAFQFVAFQDGTKDVYRTSILLKDILICQGIDSKKKISKEAAALWALIRLNVEKELFEQLVIRLHPDGRLFSASHIDVDELLNTPFEANGLDHTVTYKSAVDYLGKLSLSEEDHFRNQSNYNSSYELRPEPESTSGSYSQIVNPAQPSIDPVRLDENLTDPGVNPREDLEIPVRTCPSPIRQVYPQHILLSPPKIKSEESIIPEQPWNSQRPA